MSILKRSPFGQIILLKKLLIGLLGLVSWPGFFLLNKNKVQGTEKIRQLPAKNVLFVSNHQTYFADVAFIFHCILSSLAGFANRPKIPAFLWKSKPNLYFVAAEETMKGGLLPKLFAYGGAITVKRTWRSEGKEINRPVDAKDSQNIITALQDGWVITFPQGTTSPFAQGRKGTAHLIKEMQPVVIPIVIDGFRRAFDKKGLKFKKNQSTLRLTMKDPLDIDYSASIEEILELVMHSIEQVDEEMDNS